MELTLLSVIISSTKCVPLEHKSQPFIVVAQSGNPFLEPVDNVAEASFVESGKNVTVTSRTLQLLTQLWKSKLTLS